MEDQIILFEVANGIYGVGLSRVRTLLDPSPVYRVPHSPLCITGLLNLEGQIVPVMDLRVRLGLPPIQVGAATRFVVVDFAGQSLVLVVDAVTGVKSVPTESLEHQAAARGIVSLAPYQEVTSLDNEVIRLLDLVGLARVA